MIISIYINYIYYIGNIPPIGGIIFYLIFIIYFIFNIFFNLENESLFTFKEQVVILITGSLILNFRICDFFYLHQ